MSIGFYADNSIKMQLSEFEKMNHLGGGFGKPHLEHAKDLLMI